MPSENDTNGQPVTMYEAMAVYTCQPGYQLSNQSWEVNVTCEINGNWTELADTCEGKVYIS